MDISVISSTFSRQRQGCIPAAFVQSEHFICQKIKYVRAVNKQINCTINATKCIIGVLFSATCHHYAEVAQQGKGGCAQHSISSRPPDREDRPRGWWTLLSAS